MNRLILTILTVLTLSINTNAQTVQTKTEGFSVHLEGVLKNVKNSKILIANQNINQGRVPVTTIQVDEHGAFNSDFKIPFEDYYVFRLENGQIMNLVFKANSSLIITADANDLLNQTKIEGSNDSKLMNDFYKKYVPFKQFEDSLRNVLKLNPTKQAEVNKVFQTKAIPFNKYRNSFINTNTNSPAILATLSAVDQDKEFDLFKQIVERISINFSNSPTAKMLKGHVKTLTAQKKQNQKIGPGKPAPEIIVTGVDGKEIKLSDLKGKVVLIDMWASWCGPCRRENPNVVKAYNKYNKDGFEVFSVSFDKPGMKARWLQAIEQDGLVWPYHGSELKGFNNQAARDYSVRGIPFTCLVDAEGNVVKTNLRGPALEIELKKIFGH